MENIEELIKAISTEEFLKMTERERSEENSPKFDVSSHQPESASHYPRGLLPLRPTGKHEVTRFDKFPLARFDVKPGWPS